MVKLSNGPLQAMIRPMGAELSSLRLHGSEFLWSGDARYWGKQSPVLFPIVGSLRDGRYQYRGITYVLPRHGFARERLFTTSVISEQEAHFFLEDDEASRMVYPFRFQLRIRYLLQEEGLLVEYSIANPSEEPLLFSIGGHPAFSVPLEPGLRYDDYRLILEQPETAGRWTLQDGLLLHEEPFLNQEHIIPLHASLFQTDAIVMKGLRSEHITLESAKGDLGLRFGIKGWPHLGIWAAQGAPFVCIEPWQGHADPAGHSGMLADKPGIVTLASGEYWERTWTVQPFIKKTAL